ncbi:hypothetical protein HYE17_04445 [Mycoplasmopsis bovis]|nr:hypothetical protein [Mycoplasmopsis bovis]WHL54432.1 hypothetical protein HYE17_04445 [Mycoplasmopsis bovis]
MSFNISIAASNTSNLFLALIFSYLYELRTFSNVSFKFLLFRSATNSLISDLVSFFSVSSFGVPPFSASIIFFFLSSFIEANFLTIFTLTKKVLV